MGATLVVASMGSDRTLVADVLMLAFAALYAWGVWCGMRLLEGRNEAIMPTRIYWLLQVPYLSSPLFAYQFSSGASMALGLKTTQPQLFWNLHLGSEFSVTWLQSAPFGLGVDVFALAICWLLGRSPPETPGDAGQPTVVEPDAGVLTEPGVEPREVSP